jgi:hypothetical protein
MKSEGVSMEDGTEHSEEVRSHATDILVAIAMTKNAELRLAFFPTTSPRKFKSNNVRSNKIAPTPSATGLQEH